MLNFNGKKPKKRAKIFNIRQATKPVGSDADRIKNQIAPGSGPITTKKMRQK